MTHEQLKARCLHVLTAPNGPTEAAEVLASLLAGLAGPTVSLADPESAGRTVTTEGGELAAARGGKAGAP